MIHWQDLHHAKLSTQQLYALLQLRCAVFVVEQQCPYLDVDGDDLVYFFDFWRGDKFDSSIKNLFSSKKYYYFDKKGVRLYRNGYEEIKFNGIKFKVPNGLSVIPKKDSFKNIIFEYKK